MKKQKNFLVLFIILASSVYSLNEDTVYYRALLRSAGIFENYEVRRRLEYLMKEPIIDSTSVSQTVYSQRISPLSVQFELRLNNQNSDYVYYTFINAKPGENSFAPLRYDVNNRGTYIIRRNLRSGKIDQLKIFIVNSAQETQQSFIRFVPVSETESIVSVTLFGKLLYQNITVPYPIETLALMPLYNAMLVSAPTIQWDRIFVAQDLQESSLVKAIPQKIFPLLSQITEVDDGAQDFRGHFVKIETGTDTGEFGFNCSGFAKWVADGIYRSTMELEDSDKYLDINDLKTKHESLRGQNNSWNITQEDSLDPYFGLDWTRNIAYKLALLWRSEQNVKLIDQDVREVPFFSYIENVGYPVEDLQSLFYILAVQDPGKFYIGAINGTYEATGLHQYFHIVLIFPYFSATGEFVVRVMETGEETSLASLARRYSDKYIHLSSVGAPNSFYPAPLNLFNAQLKMPEAYFAAKLNSQ